MNIDKSKLLVFGRGRRNENLQLRYDNRLIAVVTEINYIGVTLIRSGSCKVAMQNKSEKATEAKYKVKKKKEECLTYQHNVWIYLIKLRSQYCYLYVKC